MRRSFAFRLTLLTLLWLLLAIGCQQVPGGVWWPVIFGALSTPLALLGTAGWTAYWLRRNWRVALLPLLALALCWPHMQRGLALNIWRSGGVVNGWLGGVVHERGGEVAGDAGDESNFQSTNSPIHQPTNPPLRLLSANVRIFNVYPQLRDPDLASSKGFIRWLADSPADVLCLQEFYHEPLGNSPEARVFRAVEHIGRATGRASFVSKTLTNGAGAEFGLAIFSRFPIVRRGVIPFGRLSQNHAMWADLARPHDTVRVFNLHLQSMSMDENDIATATGSRAGLRQKGRGLLRRFRNGAVARATQVDTVLAHVRRSPYPVLLAGDLNDLPYSYVYDQLADQLSNAWASAGLGIGATYNGRLPGLRIDQQFASSQWEVLGCRVHREIKWSDHFPVEGLYRLSAGRQ